MGYLGSGNFGDLDRGRVHAAAIGANPDVICAAGWAAEKHLRIAITKAVIIAIPATVRAVDDQRGIDIGNGADGKWQRASAIGEFEIRGVADHAGARTGKVGAIDAATSLHRNGVGIGREAAVQRDRAGIGAQAGILGDGRANGERGNDCGDSKFFQNGVPSNMPGARNGPPGPFPSFSESRRPYALFRKRAFYDRFEQVGNRLNPNCCRFAELVVHESVHLVHQDWAAFAPAPSRRR